MLTNSARRRKTMILGLKLFFAFSLCYLAYHAISGKNGLLVMLELQQKLERAKARQAGIAAEKNILTQHTMRLSRTLDLDLLDEQSRKMLGYSKENEVIYFTNQPKQKP